jgi:nucleotide-binding universal stress UspA family protein
MDPKQSQVVVAYDFSEHGRAVLDRAVALVSRAPFHVLHFITVIDPHSGVSVVPHRGKIDVEYADRVRATMIEELGKVLKETPLASEVHFFAHAPIGKPTEEILRLSEQIGADLILIGTHGTTGLSRLVMGSVAEHVVRTAGCPVLVVRPKAYPDVELMNVVEIDRAKPIHSRMHQFSYSNTSVIMRPPEWPIS